jgi:Fe-S-cluster containining protein
MSITNCTFDTVFCKDLNKDSERLPLLIWLRVLLSWERVKVRRSFNSLTDPKLDVTSSTTLKNVCKTHHCVACCYHTEMLLLDEDVRRIIGLGFEKSYFVTSSDGFKMLKNSSEGRCVFHDGKLCTIYANRPSGCKLYPVIFNENLNRPVKDRLCPYSPEFDLTLEAKQELTDVYLRLMEEKNKLTKIRREQRKEEARED